MLTYQRMEIVMVRYFTLEYWSDDGWYVGRLKEIPGVFSQGKRFKSWRRILRKPTG
jgi:hypothetical protein